VVVRPMELAWKIEVGLDQVGSLPKVEGDLGEVCPWRKKNCLLERTVARDQALGNIEQPWRGEMAESSHEVCTQSPA
jgi:hypothetical protein